MDDGLGIVVGLAAAAVCEAAVGSLAAAQRAGVDLPEGFVERAGAAISRRSIRALRRLALAAFREGLAHGQALERVRSSAQQEPES